jgi:hypothetical protein
MALLPPLSISLTTSDADPADAEYATTTTTTEAPRAASSTVMPRPMPRLSPVTSTTLPLGEDKVVISYDILPCAKLSYYGISKVNFLALKIEKAGSGHCHSTEAGVTSGIKFL